ncbi:MAG TPA: hypothetical protein VLX59_13470, partial [Acidimicrobiales bacterium]|nr:hypothetical protein [Acidimicrobiales bacterium]
TSLVVAVKVVVPSAHASPTAHQKLIMVGVALLIPLAAWLALGGADWMRARTRRRRDQEHVAL